MRITTSLQLVFALVIITLSPLSAESAKLFWSEKTATEELVEILVEIEKTGETEKNIEALDKFTQSYNKAKVTEEAIFVLSDIYTKQKEFIKCTKAYKRYFKKFKKSKKKSKALYGLGYCQYRNGYLEEASQNISYAMSEKHASIEVKVKSELLLETINAVLSTSAEGNHITIGATLPLNGTFAQFGEKALRGILLASGSFKNKLNNTTSIVVETRSTTRAGINAKQAVLDLAKNKKLLGIVGPLLKKNATEVAVTAQRKSIPTITLTQKENITDSGGYIFRNFMTPSQQAKTLASYATKVYFNPRALILYPSTGYGRELASLFKKEILERGGTIVAELPYDEDNKDFGKELQELFKITTTESKIGRRYVTEYETDVEADVLFIPDYYSTVAQIIPYIAYYKIKDIQLLGSNGWNSNKLIKLAGKYMDGAVFVDGFTTISSSVGTLNFINDFKDTYGYTPGIIEAQAFDATMMLLESIEKIPEESTNDKVAIKQNLETITYTSGATGSITFDDNREPEKELFLLTVKKRKIAEVVPEDIEVKRTEEQYILMAEEAALKAEEEAEKEAKKIAEKLKLEEAEKK